MPDPAATPAADPVPLVVDMDGTLLRTDTLLESLLVLLHRQPLALLKLPGWIAQGRAHAKRQIADRAALAVNTLPVNGALTTHLAQQKLAGRTLVLASGADERIARAVAARMGLFDTVLASDGATNLTGEHKRERLRTLYGEHGYDYIGNSLRDLPVLASARHGVLVDPSPALRAAAPRATEVVAVFASPRPHLADYLGAMRVHHSLKNLLLLVAPLLGQRLGDPATWLHALLGVLCFNLAAYGVYLLNDLLDLASDRAHPHKKHRALASGRLPLWHALLLVPALWLGAVGLAAAWLAPPFIAVLAVYLVLMLAYSLRLKDLAFVDALVLAVGYTLRLVAGGVATGVPLPDWLPGASMPLFFGMALWKRYAEIVTLRPDREEHDRVRAYRIAHGARIAALGIAACAVALGVLAFHAAAHAAGAHRWPVWPAGVLLLGWTAHLWWMAHRGEVRGDPVSFALRDRTSRVFGLLTLLALALVA